MILSSSPASVIPRSLPVRRAELFAPGADGQPQRTLKIAGQALKGNGAFPQFRLHQNRLSWVDSQGNAVPTLRLRDSDMPGPLLGVAGSRHAWFSTNRAVYALDTSNGQLAGQRELRYEWSPKAMHLDGDHVIIANGKQLEWLDADLNTIKTLPVSHDVASFIPIGNGMLALRHYARPSRVTLLDAQGRGHLVLEDAGAPVVDVRGRLFCIESESAPRGQPRNVICYDPATDRIERTPTSSCARSVTPRRDGSFVVMHDDGDRPALLLHREGQEPRRFDFGARGYVRELLLDENDAIAYVMLDRYRDGNRKGQTVYRIDLDRPRTLAQRLGLSRAAETLHTMNSLGEAPRLAALDDGHLLLVDNGGATLVDPARGETRPLGDRREAVKQALADSRLVTRPVQFGYARLEKPGLDALLDGAKATERDGCLDLPAQAPDAPPQPSVSVHQYSGLGLWPHKIVLRSGGQTSNVFLAPEGIKFTAATTAHGEDRQVLVAAATSNGQVHCYDPMAGIGGPPVARFDVGTSITRLGTDESGRLVAEGENGTLLLVEP